MKKQEQKQRGRRAGSLTQADQTHMAERRAAAPAEKAAALAVLTGNPQFTNKAFWSGVPSKMSKAVVDAITKGGAKAKAREIKATTREIKAMERKLAALNS